MKKIPTILLTALCAIANCQENLYNINDMEMFYNTQNRGSIENVSNSYAACFEMTNTNPDAFVGLKMQSDVSDLDLSDKDNLYFKFDIRVIHHTGTMPDNPNLQIALFNKTSTNGTNGESVFVNLISNYYNWNSNWRTIEVPLSALTDEWPNNGVEFDWSAVNNFRIRHTWSPQNNSAPQFGLTLCIKDVTVSNKSILPVNGDMQTIVLYDEGIGPNLIPLEGTGGVNNATINYRTYNNAAGESAMCVEMANTGRYAFAGFRMNSGGVLDLSNKDNLYFKFDVRVNHTGTMPNNADLEIVLFNKPDNSNGPNGERVSVKLIGNNYYSWNSNWTTVEVPLSVLTDERPNNGVAFDWSAVNNFRIRHAWPAASGAAPSGLTIGIDNVVINDASTLNVKSFNGNTNNFTINSPIIKGENIHVTGKNINTIDIYNINGQCINSKRINGLNAVHLSSSQMTSGLYIAIINKSHSKKFIVK